VTEYTPCPCCQGKGIVPLDDEARAAVEEQQAAARELNAALTAEMRHAAAELTREQERRST